MTTRGSERSPTRGTVNVLFRAQSAEEEFVLQRDSDACAYNVGLGLEETSETQLRRQNIIYEETDNTEGTRAA